MAENEGLLFVGTASGCLQIWDRLVFSKFLHANQFRKHKKFTTFKLMRTPSLVLNNQIVFQFLGLTSFSGSIISSSADGNVNVWDKKYTLVETLGGHAGPVSCMVASNASDMPYICSGSVDETLRFWRFTVQNIATIAYRIAGKN
jgi:WD40 repeat protein